jgi:tetrahydromethanopterin S-methyltransferase subunit G
MSNDELAHAVLELTKVIDKISQQLNMIEDAIVNDDRIENIEHRLTEIKEIVDGTEGKIFDLWVKHADVGISFNKEG